MWFNKLMLGLKTIIFELVEQHKYTIIAENEITFKSLIKYED
jgi:hypothetical protein